MKERNPTLVLIEEKTSPSLPAAGKVLVPWRVPPLRCPCVPQPGVVPRVPPSSPSCPGSTDLVSGSRLAGHRSRGKALLHVLRQPSSALGPYRSPREEDVGFITGCFFLAQLRLGLRFPFSVAQGGFVACLSGKMKAGAVESLTLGFLPTPPLGNGLEL